MKRRAAFYVVLGILLISSLVMVKSWLIPTLLGVIAAYLTLPLYDRLARHVRSETIRATLLVFLVFAVIAVPALFIITELSRQLPHLAEGLSSGGWLDQANAWLSAKLGRHVDISPRIETYLTSLKEQLVHSAGSIGGMIGNAALFLLVLLYTQFYILKDGREIWRNFMVVLPLSGPVKPLLVTNLKQTLAGVLYGQFFTAVGLGIVCAFAYRIFGVTHVLLWTVLTVILAMIPIVGPNVVWAPLALSRLVVGNPGQVVGMIIVCGGAAFVIDNIIKPRYIAGRSELHPLAALLGVMGGLDFFGLIGFLFGPILIGLLVAMLRFHRDVAVLRRKPAVPAAGET